MEAVVQRLWRMRALRRRSQRARFDWKRLERMTELLWPRVSIRHPWPDQRFAVGIHLNLLPGLSNEPGPPRGSDTSAAQGDHQCYRRQSADIRRYAEEALKQAARGPGGTEAVSPWTAFDFLCRVAAGGESPGTHVHSLGLWPIRDGAESDHDEALGNARRFVDTLLGPATAALAPAARIDALRLDAESRRQKSSLERFVALTGPRMGCLGTQADAGRCTRREDWVW